MPCQGTCHARQRRPIADRVDRGIENIPVISPSLHHVVAFLPFASAAAPDQILKPFGPSKLFLSCTSALTLRLHCALLL